MRSMSPQGHCGKRVFLAQQSKQQMLGANMPLSQSFRFLRGKVQHALALDGEWQFGSAAVEKRSPRWIYFSISCCIAWAEIPEPIILLSRGKFWRIRPNRRCSVSMPLLARLVTSEEYHSTRFFCVSLEHETNPVQKMSGW
jgi:hypothetical protein